MMSANNFILRKEYDGESICDWERDVYEAIQDIDAPTDEYGFIGGAIRITVEYFPDREV